MIETKLHPTVYTCESIDRESKKRLIEVQIIMTFLREI